MRACCRVILPHRLRELSPFLRVFFVVFIVFFVFFLVSLHPCVRIREDRANPLHHIMSTTLGAETKLLDDMMTNYAQRHKKVNSVEEISSLNEKVDMIMSMLSTKQPLDDPQV